ncbi:MAG: tetratricopeptide repeat protein [Candidatus Rifleibacteriota bacterium]
MKSKAGFVAFILFCLILTFSTKLTADEVDSILKQARTMIKSNQAQAAARLLNKTLVQKKSDINKHARYPEIWYYFAVSLDKIGKKELALKALKRAKKLKQEMADKTKTDSKEKQTTVQKERPAPKDRNDHPKTAKIEENTKPANKPTNGNAYSLKSLKNENARSFYRRGAAYQEQGLLHAAAEQYIKADEMEKDNLELLEILGELLDTLGEGFHTKAQTVYGQIEKLKGDKMTDRQKAAQARANIKSKKPDLKKAEEILQKLLKKDDKNVEAIVLSATIDTKRSNFKSAIKKFNKAIKLKDDNMPAYLGLGRCHIARKSYDEAIQVLIKAKNRWPESFKPLVALGKAYLGNNNQGSALLMFNQAFMMYPESFEVNLAMLEIFARNNDPRAERHLKKCESIYKGDPRVEHWKAVFFELDEKLLEARNIYAWLAMYQDEPAFKSKLRLGQLYAGKGHLTFPGNLLVKNRPRYIDNYRDLENYRLAYTYYQRALDQHPDSKEANEARAWLDANELKVSEAIQFESLVQSYFRN